MTLFEPKRILVGVELSTKGLVVTSGSLKAAEQAARIARTTSGSLTFFHSTYMDEYAERVRPGQRVFREGLSDDGRKALSELMAQFSEDGVPCELIVSGEKAWVAMARRAQEGRVDLIVVGKRNDEESTGRRLGSVPSRLFTFSPVPVWAVKPPHDLGCRLILCATDLSAVGDAVTQTGAWLAKLTQADLHLVNVYSVPMELQEQAVNMSAEDYGARLEQLKEASEDAIRESLGERYAELDYRLHVGRSRPAQAIIEAVGHFDPDLLVMGALSFQRLSAPLLGDTAERVLDQVDCSLLVLKPEGYATGL